MGGGFCYAWSELAGSCRARAYRNDTHRLAAGGVFERSLLAVVEGSFFRPAGDRIVHLSYGDVPADHYVNEVATDLLIHGWDLARAIGADCTERAGLKWISPSHTLSSPHASAASASSRASSKAAASLP